MRLHKTIHKLVLMSAITISSINADDGSEFNILPSSPLDAEFFSQDIPASYLTAEQDKTALNYAIIESGPTAELNDDEIYIKHLPATYDIKSSERERIIEEKGIYLSAAGEFIDEDTEIPENLVYIEPSSISHEKTPDIKGQTPAKSSTDKPKAGVFVSDEDGGVTAATDQRDRYTAFPAGSFSIGYRIMYLNYLQDDKNANYIYNGITAEYSHKFANSVVIKGTTSLLGGVGLDRDYGSIYSDSKLLLGTEFTSTDNKFSITPYLGCGLRYTNNVFSTSNIIERNTLQLYIPVGLRADYKSSEKFTLFAGLEASPIAFEQNWTEYRVHSENTSTAFNGVSILFELGSELTINNVNCEIKPYYQYIYTGNDASSASGNSHTHIAGINAVLKF